MQTELLSEIRTGIARHPAFAEILAVHSDDTFCVARVRYRSHPDYVGGVYTEAYAWTGECLEHDLEVTDLSAALRLTVDLHGEEF